MSEGRAMDKAVLRLFAAIVCKVIIWNSLYSTVFEHLQHISKQKEDEAASYLKNLNVEEKEKEKCIIRFRVEMHLRSRVLVSRTVGGTPPGT